MNDYPDVETSLADYPPEDRATMRTALATPDMYPAARIAQALGVTTAAVHAYRRARDIKKATS